MARKIEWKAERGVVVKAAGELLFSIETVGAVSPAAKKFAAAAYGADEIVVIAYGHSNDRWGGEFRAHRSFSTYKVGPSGWYCAKRTTRTV